MKKKLLVAWRILVSAGMVGVLIIAGILVSLYCQEQQRYRRDAYLTETSNYSDKYQYVYRKNTVRLKDRTTGKYLTPKLSYIYDAKVVDTLTVFFQNNNKRGYLNIYTGKIEIPAQYEKAWIFSEGLGAVVQDDKMGFINKKGETIISFQFAWNSPHNKHEGFLFKDGYCSVFDSSGKQGLIDKNGTWIMQPQYDYIYNPVDGYRIVYNADKYGLMNDSLQLVLPIEYDNIELVEEGIVLRKGSDQKLYAYDLKTILNTFVYSNLKDVYYNSETVNEEGETIYILSGYKMFSIGDKYGLMDKNGHVVANAIYREINVIKNDLFSCLLAGRDYYITINGKGEVIQ
jgi:hypothetical protein